MFPAMFSLEGKVAAVTGPTRGIGRALAVALAEAGASVALLQRDAGQADVREQIGRLGADCAIIPCDLTDSEAPRQALEGVVSRFGRIDILVNNAGIQHRASAAEFAEADWERVLNVNLHAVWRLSQAAGKHMIRQRRGKIINIASLLSFQGGLRVPAYAASKGGVSQLTKALANEWGPHGIRVNAIAPGMVATDLNAHLVGDTKRLAEMDARIPAGRWGHPDDMKGSVVFLASDASDYVNGHILVVDGGWMGR